MSLIRRFAVGAKLVEKSLSEPARPGQARPTECGFTSFSQRVQECAPSSGLLLAVGAKLVKKISS